MLSREKLIKTKEYWMETIQNNLFRQLNAYMEDRHLNQNDLAEKLGVTKGYISQVLNGNFNFTIGKLIELSLAIEMVPDIEFRSFKDYLHKQEDVLHKIQPKNKRKLRAIRTKA